MSAPSSEEEATRGPWGWFAASRTRTLQLVTHPQTHDVVGMVAPSSTVVRAPLTGIVSMVETNR